MSDTVIRVENLSKAYIISHQNGERYTALRDVLANGVKSVASSVWRGAGARHATRNTPPATEEFWALNDVSFHRDESATTINPIVLELSFVDFPIR